MTTTTHINRATAGRTTLSLRARTIAACLLTVALLGCSEKSLDIKEVRRAALQNLISRPDRPS